MRIGDLVKSKWCGGIIGILLAQVESDPFDTIWRVRWFGIHAVFAETCEDQGDLEVM
tara:strand:+ start:569 stop:739 length:171 start_codon:yes stop_codon:yes gene_type:complete